MRLKGCHVHIDGVSGAAGDMFLGALIDVGVPEGVVREALGCLGYAELLKAEKTVKGGISATNVTIAIGHGHGHGHEHHHHHTAYRDIRNQIDGSKLSEGVKKRALDIFARLARAEAAIHGTDIEKVEFHEVGAVDAICDVVGAAAGFDWLGPCAVSAATITLGQGGVRSEHGLLPVPSPAAVRILAEVGAPVRGGDIARELCTPTGAAILASVVTAWGQMPELVPAAIGYGAGDAELADRPNLLRLIAGRAAVRQSGDEMLYLRANLDDMNPEWCEQIATRLQAIGAVDVWWTPIVMKKSRPALELSALVPEVNFDAACSIFFRDATTLGVRYDRVSRRLLRRAMESVETAYGTIAMKVAYLGDEQVNAAPEFEDCRAAAERCAVPLKEIYAAAQAAWRTKRVLS